MVKTDSRPAALAVWTAVYTHLGGDRENFEPQRAAIEYKLGQNCKKYTFQYELSDELKSNFHFQMTFSLKKKVRKKNLLDLLDKVDDDQVQLIRGQWWVSPASDPNAAFDYCAKNESRVAGPWHDGSHYTGQDIVNLTNYPWQNQFFELIKSKSDRHINIILDVSGSTGKSKVIKKLLFEKPDKVGLIQVFSSGSQLCKGLCSLGPKELYILDLPRSIPNKQSFDEVLTVLEYLKNGLVQSNMYGGSDIMLFDPPEIYVFCNKPFISPSTFSVDRYRIFEINSILVPMVPVTLKRYKELYTKELVGHDSDQRKN